MENRDVAACVRAARAGDREALGTLYGYLRVELLPHLERMLPPGLEADDVLTDVLLRLWRTLDRLRDEKRFLACAYRAARNFKLDWLRQRRRHGCAELPHDYPVADVAARNLETDELLAGISAALDAQELKLFCLLYVDGATDHEAQQRLHLTPTHLRVRRHRLHAKLRRVVRRWRSGRLRLSGEAQAASLQRLRAERQ